MTESKATITPFCSQLTVSPESAALLLLVNIFLLLREIQLDGTEDRNEIINLEIPVLSTVILS